MANKLTSKQRDKAVAIVAAWLGPQLGHNGPAPVSREAAYSATGPMFDVTGECTSGAPSLILEGGPESWPILAGDALRDELAAIGVWTEAYSSWALCLYPID